MLNIGITKIFDYFKNLVDSYETFTALPRKRSLTEFNDEDESDDDIPVVEPPLKRSKFYENPSLSSPILKSGSSKFNFQSPSQKIDLRSLSPEMSSSLQNYGGAIRRSHLEVSDDVKNLFQREHLSAEDETDYARKSTNKYLSPKNPNIDPLFKFSPSLCSTTIRSTKSYAATLARKPISPCLDHGNIYEMKKPVFKNRSLHKILDAKSNLMSSRRFTKFFSKMNKYNTPMQSHRLDEHVMYKQLLQQHTSSPVITASTNDSLRDRSYYRKEEHFAMTSGALKKSVMDRKWVEKKRLMLNQEERKGTAFPKEAISVLDACTRNGTKNISFPIIDFGSPTLAPDDDVLITKEVVVKKKESNSLIDRMLKKSEFYDYKWFKNMKETSQEKEDLRKNDLKQASKEKQQWEEYRKSLSHAHLLDSVSKRISLLDMKYPVKVIEIVDEEEELPELTDVIERKIDRALRGGPGSQILADKFNIQIRRKDLHTLSGLNWLNDEIINFYMNLLMERSENENKYPKVYAFNTFFYSKLTKLGYSSVKRWTKKVDIFNHDLLLVPIHLGMHWCLATIDFRAKTVRYYDSMLGDNNKCLGDLRKYLDSEHHDKKKSSLDLSSFSMENVKEIPQQMNGSDCGMFSCKFAEYLSRDSPITFDQEHMPYFRRRMVHEIVSKTLM